MTNKTENNLPDFLITEYQAVLQEYQRLRNEGLNRLNFFITITTLFGGGLVLLNEVGSPSSNTIQIISIGALFFLMIIGWFTFSFTIDRDINSDHATRSMARIRRYYSNQYPEIEPHLTWRDDDEPTAYLINNKSGVRQTAQTILTLVSALFFAALLNLFIQQLLISFISGMVAFLIIFIVLRAYAQRKFSSALNIARRDVRFPTRGETTTPRSPGKVQTNPAQTLSP